MTILTVTPNPSIDKTAIVPDLQLGNIHRPQQMLTLAGGKGLNVARTIRVLGGEVHTCVLLAGQNGKWIEKELAREHIATTVTWTTGETRTCLSVIDPKTRAVTELYEDGNPVEPADWIQFVESVAANSGSAKLITISGSLPPGAPEDGYAQLIQAAKTGAAPVLVDTHGNALRHALHAAPYLVKVNASELSELLARPIVSAAQAAVGAQQLRYRGTCDVVVTLGDAGAVVVDGTGAWQIQSPSVTALSAVGSGDALMGGMALALARGEPLVQAIVSGVAIGAANTLAIGAGVFDPGDAEELMSKVRVNVIPE
jgi:tagatose 6-phosphate kinase